MSECISQDPDCLYCTACNELCRMYEQGLCCSCDQPWLTEVYDPDDYPEKWIKVTVQVWKP